MTDFRLAGYERRKCLHLDMNFKLFTVSEVSVTVTDLISCDLHCLDGCENVVHDEGL